jgi:putative NIF3 family GTP cyclohydrolase 1 type 2
LLDAAVEAEADLVLVHHGYFWKGETRASPA